MKEIGMDSVRTFRLNITPRTHIRATVGDKILFKIPRDKLRNAGLKRLIRLEKYNEYKINLASQASAKQFVPVEQGMHIVFYLPVAKSWKKYKQKQMHLQLHQNRPDIDNLAKSFLDSLLQEDKHIADIRFTKRWVNQEKGYIDIFISTPTFQSKDTLI